MPQGTNKKEKCYAFESGRLVKVKGREGIKLKLELRNLHDCNYSCSQNNITPSEVTQWTNHRVMEWLRSVDLAEYAPNLRGSGVHGGLMVRD